MEQVRAEFARFYESSRDECLRTMLAVVGDPQLAEDLVADAYAKAWASWRKVSRHPAPTAWLMRTALNTRVSWWRRRRREVALDGHDPATAGQADAGLDQGLLTVLHRLPQRQREVIALRVFLDLDTGSAAQVLGIAEGTVKAHLARALGTLRRHLITVDHEEG